MAVYYKFKSAKDYHSIVMHDHFISVGHLKERIFESKYVSKGTDFDLVVTHAQTNEEYLDEGVLIPKNTSVLVRRVPGHRRKPIVTAPVMEQEGIPINDAPPVSKEGEESKIKALIDTPALGWQRQPSDKFGPGRGFGRGMVRGMMGGRAFGRGGFGKKTSPKGYICHRCKVPGHFLQHCPTNGDPTFDIKRVIPPTGIPKSLLMATTYGSYALPSGAVAILKPNEAAFEKEVEGMPSKHSVCDLLPELHCPLCKEVMKYAVLTSKCWFASFCDKCI